MRFSLETRVREMAVTSTASWPFQPSRQNVIFWPGSSGSVDLEFQSGRARDVSLGQAFEIQGSNGDCFHLRGKATQLRFLPRYQHIGNRR